MVRIVEQIEREYDEAREAGLLNESGAMPLFDSEDLVLVARESLERMAARLEEAERELCEWKFEQSIAWFRAQGYTEDKCLSPEDLVDETPHGNGRLPDARADDVRKLSVEGKAQSTKSSFSEVFGNLFAKKTKQVG